MLREASARMGCGVSEIKYVAVRPELACPEPSRRIEGLRLSFHSFTFEMTRHRYVISSAVREIFLKPSVQFFLTDHSQKKTTDCKSRANILS